MAFAGTHWLIIWNDFGGADEREYESWIVREHMHERMQVPGFRRGRRYVGEGSPRYLNMYEVDGIDPLIGGAYVASLNAPSAWTKRMMPGLTNFSRVVCQSVAVQGPGVPGHLASFRVPLETAGGAERTAALGAVLDSIAALPAVLGASIGLTIPAPSKIDTAEKRLRTGERDVVASEAVVAIEAASAGTLDEAVREVGAMLTARLARPSAIGTYALSLLLDPASRKAATI